MNIRLILVPYDLGRESVRKGNAPDFFIQNGLEERLRDCGHTVTLDRIRLEASFSAGEAFPSEIGSIFEINRALSRRVRSSVAAGHVPVVLAGNCNSCIGTLAGLAPRRLGVVWFDAHGDFNTPETTLSGYIDGMGLSMAAGRCWRALLNTVDGFKPVDETLVIHAGARDLDAQERAALIEAGIPLVMTPAAGDSGNLDSLASALTNLTGRVEGVYLHLDMDVLLPSDGSGDPDQLPVGISAQAVGSAIGLIKERFKIEGCVIASYDPALDRDNQILKSGMELIQEVVSS